jgi:uncharacterized protein (DUF2235 family)
MEPPGAFTPWARTGTRLLGMALGYGLFSDVRNVYVYLMNQYAVGDRIFLFGYSRGAYVVRAVAALIHAYGLIPPDNEPLVPYAVRSLGGIGAKNTDAAAKEALKLAAEFKTTFGSARHCHMHLSASGIL